MKKFVLCMAALPLFAFSLFGLTKTWQDNGKLLINPDMGWCDYVNSYPAKDPATLKDWSSVHYFRTSWASVQPTEDNINFTLFDTAIARARAEGKQIAFRITTSMLGSSADTPAWVYKAGAKYKVCTHRGVTWNDPVFDDPVFLAKVKALLNALGKRYNGNPVIAYVDVGTFGTWGEAHTVHSHKLSQPETDRIAMIHAKLHRAAFPDTQLIISDDVVGPWNVSKNDFPLLVELRKMKISLRDDSILCGTKGSKRWWYHDNLAQNYWPKLPVAIEHEHFPGIMMNGVWSNENLLKAVEVYHATYLSIQGPPEAEKAALGPYYEKISRRLGYRLLPEKLTYPDVIELNKPFLMELYMRNLGVAPCYRGGYPALTLKNRDGEICAVMVSTGFDVKNVQVGPLGKTPARRSVTKYSFSTLFPALTSGEYDLYFSIGSAAGVPRYAMPIDGDDGARRYCVGKIRVKSTPPAYLKAGGKGELIWDKVTAVPKCETHLVKVLEFKVPPKKVEFHVVADDFCKPFVNGRALSPDFMGGWSTFKSFDVTALVKPGSNLFAIHGKNGAASCGALAEIVVTLPDGTQTIFVTDSSWRASDTPSPNWQRDPAVSASWKNAVVSEAELKARIIHYRENSLRVIR